MTARERILAAVLAVAAGLATIGTYVLWGTGVALLVASVLLAGGGWLLLTEPVGDKPVEAAE